MTDASSTPTPRRRPASSPASSPASRPASGPTSGSASGPVPDPLNGGFRMGYAPVEVSRRSFVLADRLTSCRFLYRRALIEPPFEVWEEVWTPLPNPLPTAIRVEMQPLAGESGRLRHSPVTVPLHFLRSFEDRYEDK